MSPNDASTNALIVAQMRPALVKYFKRKCGAADQAEDLAQDVLVRALAHATWKSPEQAKGYIFRSAVNRWRDHRRITLTHGVAVEWDDAAAEVGVDAELMRLAGGDHRDFPVSLAVPWLDRYMS